MTAPIADPTVFDGASSLASLKAQVAAHNPQALKEAAQQFESLFINMMLKSMREANFKDPLFGSSQQSMYQDMYDQQLSIELSKTHSFGLADMLVQQLRRQYLGPGQDQSQENGPSRISGTPGTGSVTAGRSASAASRTSVSPAQQAAFARSVWPDATQAARKLGVSPVSLVAQAALETDWGRSIPRSGGGMTSNNLFGIKAGGAWSGASVVSATHEYHQGIKTAVQGSFRAYGSCAQCFNDYTRVLSADPRYAAALGTGNDVGAFASALQQAGYATDPDYARKLTSVASTLTQLMNGTPTLKSVGAAPITAGSEPL